MHKVFAELELLNAVAALRVEAHRYSTEEVYYFAKAIKAVSRCMQHGTDKRTDRKSFLASGVRTTKAIPEAYRDMHHYTKGLSHAARFLKIDDDSGELHVALATLRFLMAIATAEYEQDESK